MSIRKIHRKYQSCLKEAAFLVKPKMATGPRHRPKGVDTASPHIP